MLDTAIETSNLYILILAGGQGTRLWPLSRKYLPKQFLPLAENSQTMLQNTVQRALKITGSLKNIFIVALTEHKNLIRQQLPELPEENLILEPVGKSTAASIGIGALTINKKTTDGIMLVLPSDHLLKNAEHWIEAIQTAINYAQKHDSLVSIGIKPIEASTNYGYIQIGKKLETSLVCPVFHVKKFIEKPDYATATEFISSNQFLWNTGTYIWRISVFLNALQKYLPTTYHNLAQADRNARSIETNYQKLTNISVDHGIVEKASNVAVVKGKFQRIDVGTLTTLSQLLPLDSNGNSIQGHMISRNSRNNIAYTDNGLIGLIDVDDLVVIRQNEIVLVCPKAKVGEVKNLLAQIETEGLIQYK